MSVILPISDMHMPFAHPDVVPFLAEIKRKYRPSLVVCLGDEADKQALKFHPVDPDLPSCGDELDMTVQALQPIYQLFPKVAVIESNHTSLAYRKALVSGISRKYLKEYRDVLRAPPGWNWFGDITVTEGFRRIYFHHGLSRDARKVVERRGISYVQGHFHEEFSILYSGNPGETNWGMTCGCLIDRHSPAFAYNKANIGRPIIGTGIIINGLPKLLPLVEDSSGRWIGEVA